MNEARTLEIAHLTFGYTEAKRVLRDVSFSLREGTYACIIGHNGSGKSTLAECVMGLLGGFQGEIKIFGTPLTKKTVYSLRSHIGIVFQNPDNQFVGSTVADDIAFGLENRQVPHEQMQGLIEKYAKETGMEGFLEHEPQMLSGGQKQRVAIAGVLSMEPDFVIFDEATAMLDPKGKKEIAALIAKMRKANPKLTVLSITHDIEEAALADQVIVLNEGEVLLDGTPEAVFAEKEKLEAARLGVPFAYALKSALEKEGITLPEAAHTLEEMEDALCR